MLVLVGVAVEGAVKKSFDGWRVGDGFLNEGVEGWIVGEEHDLLDGGVVFGGEEVGEAFDEDGEEFGFGVGFRDFAGGGDEEGAMEGFGGEGFVEGAGEGFGSEFAGGFRIELVGAGGGDDADEAFDVVVVAREIFGEVFENFRVAGRMAGVELVDGMDQAAAQKHGPDAIDKGAREGGVVADGGVGKLFAAGEAGNVWLEIFFGGVDFLFVLGGPIFAHGFAVKENEFGGEGAFAEVGVVDEAADGGLGHGAAGVGAGVFAAVERGDHAPVMALLDFGNERVAVALGAFDLHAERDGREGFGYDLMIVAALEDEPFGAGVFGMHGAGEDDLANDLVPGTVAREGGFEEARPGFVGFAAVAMGFGGFVDAAHENDVEDFAHVDGILRTGEKLVDQCGAIWLCGEGGEFGLSWNAADQIEVNAAGEGGVVGGLGGFDAKLFPTGFDEVIDDAGGIGFPRPIRNDGGFGGGEDLRVEGNLICGRKLLDPAGDDGDLFVVELLAFGGRHFGIGAGMEDLDEAAFARVAGDDNGAVVAAFENGGRGAEVDAGFLFHASVALGAVVGEDGFDVCVPKGAGCGAGIFGGGGAQAANRKDGPNKGSHDAAFCEGRGGEASGLNIPCGGGVIAWAPVAK